MRRLFCLFSTAAVLSGCGQAARSVAGLAENTRTATEQMASASEVANVSREIEIYPDASSLRNTPPLKLSQRYETRQGPDGFMIYDTEAHSIARIGSQNQAGLTLDQAEKASEALAWASDHNEVAGEEPNRPLGAPR